MKKRIASMCALSVLLSLGAELAVPRGAGAVSTTIAAAQLAQVLSRIHAKRDETWHWQEVAGLPKTHYAATADRSQSLEYRRWVLELWTKRAEAAKEKARNDGALSKWVMKRGELVSREIHRSGGYRFDGWNDCYGFVKRTWNPILGFLKRHKIPGEYPYVLPVGDYPSSHWTRITSWDELIPGDVLGTVQGHRGGADVDYGMYAGKKDGVVYQFSNGGGDGPVIKPYTGRYQYYYIPTHRLLKQHGGHPGPRP